MNIQLTDYGVQLLTETNKPLQIKKYVLGSEYGYTPDKNAAGIKGSTVYSGQIQSYTIITANVVRYTIALDYQVGPFSFGEIAYFDDKGLCVAVAVNESLINKTSQNNVGTGISLRIDSYLSMVNGQYDMWNDQIGSDIKFQVPVIKSVDLLPPVHQSDPNMYIIPPSSEGVSATLAYSANNGLWMFDCYQFNNVRTRKVVSATATSITIDLTDVPEEARRDILPNFYGDRVIEFIDGENYSICRNVASVTLLDTTAVLSFKTPFAKIPQSGDSIYYFARTQVSVTDLQIPIASKTKLGGIVVGDGLTISSSGVLTPDFPVTSVNNYQGDVKLTATDIPGFANVATSGDYNDLINRPSTFNLPVASATVLGGIKTGNQFQTSSDGTLSLTWDPIKTVNNKSADLSGNVSITAEDLGIKGLINPTNIQSNADLNTYTTTGLFYCVSAIAVSVKNTPKVGGANDFSLEVIPCSNLANVVIQRWSDGSRVYTRMYNSVSWTTWTRILTESSLPIADTKKLGVVQVGNGLTITPEGLLSANVLSFNGRTGAVEFTQQDLLTELTPLYDVEGGIPQLTANPAPDTEEGLTDQQIMDFARIQSRRLPLGTCYYVGNWDCVANSINGDPLQKLSDNGLITIKNADEDEQNEENPESLYKTFQSNGYIVRVQGLTDDNSPIVIDGLNEIRNGDLLITIGNKWQLFKESSSTLYSTSSSGILVSNGTRSPKTRNIVSNTNQLTITNPDGVAGSIDINLSEVGKAGTYFKTITDQWGRVISGENPTKLDEFGIVDAVHKTGDTLTGTLNYDPSIEHEGLTQNSLVPKWFVESVAQGIVTHKEVVTCTTSNIAGVYKSGNGAKPGVNATFTTSTELHDINGVPLKLNDRILIKDQADKKQNGVYTVTSLGSNTVFTRATDFDGDNTTEGYVGSTWLVTQGNQFNGTSWTLATPNPVFGTSDIEFSWTAKPSEYKTGAGLTVNSNVISVNQGTTVSVINNKFEVNSGSISGQPLLSGTPGQKASYGKLDLSSTNNVTGVLSVANGGTGKSTADESLQVIMPPATKKGTMIYFNGIAWVVLQPGEPGSILSINDDGDLQWTQNISGGLY